MTRSDRREDEAADAPRTLIAGGRIIDPASGLDATGDVLLHGQRVAAVETKPRAIPADAFDHRIDAAGLIVSPGLLDIHVHLRDPSGGGGPVHEEDVASGTASAANGGFTTVCCMPNTSPPLDSVEVLDALADRASRQGACRVFIVACATVGRRGEMIAPLDDLAHAGAIAFSDDGDAVVSDAVMTDVLRETRRLDRVFMQHCQDPAMTAGGVMNAGAIALRLGLSGWPRAAEERILDRDLHLNREIGARYHAQHLSSGASPAILQRAQASGQPATGEASPHHLLLTEEACATYDTNAKMNPPLRGQSDINALKEAIARGIITVLATDHAPHPPHTKQTDFTSASFGIVGLDCALPLYAKALIDDGVLNWPAMLRLLTIEPARVAGLDRVGIGRLAVGGPADVTVIDPSMEWTIDVEEFASAGRNCPFRGWNVRGRAVMTIVNGVVCATRMPV